MNRNIDFKTLALKNATHDRIKAEADASGMKIWALVDRMAEDYFSHRGI